MSRSLLALLGVLAGAPDARACGCFTPPDPTVPVVQVGERILFAHEGNDVVAHIQIQYAGDAKDFGWLLPLPSVPTLELGMDEVFTRLTEITQPRYYLDYDNQFLDCSERRPGNGERDLVFSFPEGDLAGQDQSPVVVASSIGPYDYAVLKADDKAEMLGWLTANRYFVPGGTDVVLDQYLHKGAYFLALKLKSGRSVGDLQPVIVRYASDLPMIPIVLTSTGAQPHMGVAVWLVGEGRAIPRNYYHTVIDDAAIDWLSRSNYGDVLTRAVAEAPRRHSFVTEYAGSGKAMPGLIDWPGRFGDTAKLATITDPVEYVVYLSDHGYPFTNTLLGILTRYIPAPEQMIDAPDYYANIRYYVGIGLGPSPGAKVDGAAITAEIVAGVVEPTHAAARLFVAHPYLTRLFTVLSPEDMTSDPVFSFNPSLPEVSREHRARLTYRCDAEHARHATLRTEQGFAIDMPYEAWSTPDVKASLRTEILREEGPPEVVVDNAKEIEEGLPRPEPTYGAAKGCSVETGRERAGRGWTLAGVALFALAAVWLVGRRRR